MGLLCKGERMSRYALRFGLAVLLVSVSVPALPDDIVPVPVLSRTAAPQHLPEVLRDVVSRLAPGDDRRAVDPRFPDDHITTVHEGTHFLNSNLSTPGTRGFYTLYGEGWRVPCPKHTRLTQVAALIPERLRGKVFKTYLLDSKKDWDAFPLYLFDEWLAYQNGSLVRVEMGWDKRGETVQYMAELAIYSCYVLEAIDQNEGDSYPIDELAEFFDFLLERSRIIAPEFDTLPLVADSPLAERRYEE